MKNLASCVANCRLPADFPPLDLPIQVTKYDSSHLSGNSLIASKMVATAPQPLVAISDAAKRPREPEMQATLSMTFDISRTIVCSFVPSESVS
jgi:hypothetical protein